MHAIDPLLSAAVQARGHRPLLTFRDLESGENVELGVAAAANWVRKAANLLIEQHAAGPHMQIPVAASTHWTSVVAAWAVWATGACIEVSNQQEWFVVADVLACGDHLDAPPPQPEATAVHTSDDSLTYAQLLQAPAEPLGRALLQAAPLSATWCATLVAALHDGGSLVIVHGGDADTLARISEQQRVTRTVQ